LVKTKYSNKELVMTKFEEKSRDNFVKLMQRQNFEWLMIEAGLVEEEQESKPIKPKKDKNGLEKRKS
jgi:hypothetical protein